MLGLVVTFLVVAIIAGLVGFTNITRTRRKDESCRHGEPMS